MRCVRPRRTARVSRSCACAGYAIAFAITLFTLAGDARADPVGPLPTCSGANMQIPLAPMWNEPFSGQIRFGNSGDQTGYMPYIDVFVPSGFTLTTANITMNGYAVTVLPIPLKSGSPDHYIHPLTGAELPNTNANDHTLAGMSAAYTIRLATGQIPITADPFTIGFPLGFSAGTNPNSVPPPPAPPLATTTLRYQCGFWYGNSPLQAPTVTEALQSVGIEPQVIKIWKDLDSDHARVAGPIDTNRWRLHVDIATGVSLTSLSVRDVLAATHQTTDMDLFDLAGNITGSEFRLNGAPVTFPAAPLVAPGGTATLFIDSTLGETGEDLRWEIEGYYDDDTLDNGREGGLGNPICGYDWQDQGATGSYYWRTNTADVTGGVIDIDPALVRVFSGPLQNSILNESQQPVNRVPILTCEIEATPDAGCPVPADMVSNDVDYAVPPIGIRETIASGGASRPGDTRTITTQLRISNYFEFDNIVVRSELPDGLTPVDTAGAYQATLTVGTDSPETITAQSATHYTTGVNKGAWTLVWQVRPSTGIHAIPNGKIVTLSFQVKIDQAYENRFYVNTTDLRPVSAGDVLVTVEKVETDVTNMSACAFDDAVSSLGTSKDSEGDQDIAILPVELSKEIIRVRHLDGSTIENGGAALSNVELVPGDLVTFRLSSEIPSGDTDFVEFEDMLPAPKFYSGEHLTAELIPPAPAASDPDPTSPNYTPVRWGAGHDTGLIEGGSEFDETIDVTVSAFAANNSITWRWDRITNDEEPDPHRQIVLEYDATVLALRSADQLELTNIFNGHSGAGDAIAVVDVLCKEPSLIIRKSVVGISSGYSGPTPLFDIYQHPNLDPENGYLVTDATLIDANYDGADGGDIVTFAIVIENVGHAVAHDVNLKDYKPSAPALLTPSQGFDVTATSGNSAVPVSFTHTQGSPQFPDTSADALVFESLVGADAAGANQTANIIVVLMNFEIPTSADGTPAHPNDVYTNTGEISHAYSVPEADIAAMVAAINAVYPDLVTLADFDLNTAPLSDPATVTIRDITLTKTLDTGSPDYDANVQIGDKVPYTVVVTIPEGTTNGATYGTLYLRDTMSGANGALDAANLSAQTTANLSITYDGSTPNAQSPSVSGADVTWYYDLFSNGASNTANETLTYSFATYVTGVNGGGGGHTLCNAASLVYPTGSVSDSGNCMAVIEPSLSTTCGAPLSAGAGETKHVSYTFNSTGGSGTTAYRYVASLTLPTGVTVHDGAAPGGVEANDVTVTKPAGSTVTNETVTASSIQVSIDKLNNAESVTIEFDVDINPTANHGQSYDLRPTLTWDSQPTGTASPYHQAYDDGTGQCSQTITVSVPTITKAWNSNRRSIGDSFEYDIDVPVSTGQTANIKVSDPFATNLLYVSHGTFSVDAGITCDDTTCTLPTPTGAGTPADPKVWVFSNVKNTDTDAGVEHLRWRVTARIGPSAAAGNGLINRATVYYKNAGGSYIQGVTGTAATVTVQEPSISVAVTTNTNPVDGLSTPTFTVSSTNASGSNRSTAYDFSTTLQLSSLPFTIPSPGAGSVIFPGTNPGACTHGTPTVTATSVNVVWTGVPTNTTCQFQVVCDTADTILLASVYNVPASGSATSIGSDDSAGDQAAEKTYNANGSLNVNSTTPTIDKSLLATDSTSTSGDRVAIGETATYRIRIDVPVGTLAAPRFVDAGQGLTITNIALATAGNPGGMAYGVAPSYSGTTGGAAYADIGSAADGGLVINSGADGNTSNDYLLFDVAGKGTFTLVPPTADGQNVVTLYKGAAGGNNGTSLTSDSYPVDIALPKPRLTITKDHEPEDGDTVIFTATLINNGDGPVCPRAAGTVIDILLLPESVIVAPGIDALDNDGDGSTDEPDEASLDLNPQQLQVPLDACLAPGGTRTYKAKAVVGLTPSVRTVTARLGTYNTLPAPSEGSPAGSDFGPAADGYDNDNDATIDGSDQDDATVTVYTNDIPLAKNYETWIFKGTPYHELDVQRIVTDPDGDPLPVGNVTFTPLAGGTASIDAQGVIRVTPTDPNSVGDVHITVDICDADPILSKCTDPDADILVHIYDCMDVFAIVSDGTGAPVGTVHCQVCYNDAVNCDVDQYNVAIVNPELVCPDYAGGGQ